MEGISKNKESLHTFCLPSPDCFRPVITRVRPASPAAESGIIMEGDILEAVDHVDILGLTIHDIKRRITGKSGTSVNLSFLRERDGDVFRYDLELSREIGAIAAESKPGQGAIRTAEENLRHDTQQRLQSFSAPPHPLNLGEDGQPENLAQEISAAVPGMTIPATPAPLLPLTPFTSPKKQRAAGDPRLRHQQ